MRDPNGQRPGASAGPHLLLYDGTCGLCEGVVQAVLPRDRRGLFHFASLQGAAAGQQLARFSGIPQGLDSFVVIADYRGDSPAALFKARAALFVFRLLGWPWRAASLLRVLPFSWLDRLYDVLARHRYRIFGRRDHCLVPRPEYVNRFLDSGR